MPKGQIVEYTERVAREMALKFEGAPLDELRAWVRIAHQREAMVTQLYELSHIDARLAVASNASSQSPCSAVVRSAIASIWAHEESHTHFLSSLRSLSEAFPDLAGLQGQLEGRITLGAVSGSVLAKVLIALGASLGRTPDFALELRRMTLRRLIEFHGELEATARMGYRRILDLCRPQYGAAVQHGFGYTLPYDIARILAEEAFHEEAFGAMAAWVAPDAESFASIAPDECVRVLHDLCERNLALGAVQGLLSPGSHVPKGDETESAWISHGGLGELFARYALPVPVLSEEAARAQTSGIA
jgi:hypothetical protein